MYLMDIYEPVFAIDINSFMQAYWPDAKSFLNSSFITAFAGAAAGAWGAQHVAERAKLREELIREIHNTNRACLVAFGICNSLLSIKRQHIKALKENFDSQKSAFTSQKELKKLGQVKRDVAFEVRMDLQNLTIPQLPSKILQNQIFENLSLIGRPLNLTTTLDQVLDSLATSLEERNQLISSFKSNAVPADMQGLLYFGEPIRNNVDMSYPDLIDAIYSYTDDGIFFSRLLCDDLIKHGEQVNLKFKNKFGKGAPKVNEIDFSAVEKSGLMPDKKNYRSWYDMFLVKEKSPTLLDKARKFFSCVLNGSGSN